MISVVCAAPAQDSDDVISVTDLGYMKRTKASQFEMQRRGGKGLKAIGLQKNGGNGTCVAAALVLPEPGSIAVMLASGQQHTVASQDLAGGGTRTSRGSAVVMAVLGDTVTGAFCTLSGQ